ncbi:MAG TPA: hypothetical protein VGL38_09700 [bacterium]
MKTFTFGANTTVRQGKLLKYLAICKRIRLTVKGRGLLGRTAFCILHIHMNTLNMISQHIPAANGSRLQSKQMPFPQGSDFTYSAEHIIP